MPSETRWHDLLEAAVPELDAPADAFPRLTTAVGRARRRRRLLLSALPVTAAALAAAGILVAAEVSSRSGQTSRNAGVTSPLINSSVGLAEHLTGAVAYKCGDSICLMNPDGTGERTLDATFPEWDAAWSPNGQQLAFRGYYATGDGSYAIYVVGADGCNTTRLPGTDGGLTPTWSPDGGQIAFGSGFIRVINADGSQLHAITDGGPTVHDRWTDSQPAWSSTEKIAFVRADRGSNQGEIYTVNPDGSHPSAITNAGSGYFQPSWSPTGSQLAMVAPTTGSIQVGTPMQIDVVNADGTDRHSISPSAWSSYSPTWTPDGRVVFLVRDASGADSAYIVNPDGSDLRKLYTNLGGTEGSWQITWGKQTLPAAKCAS